VRRGGRGVVEGIKRDSRSATLLGLCCDVLLEWVRERRLGLSRGQLAPSGFVLRGTVDPARCPCGARAADHE
jgi:hypothetical protein